METFWDLGCNDLNTIWVHQHVDGYDRFIGYYENSGEFIGHYVAWLNAWAKERNATFGATTSPMTATGGACGLKEAPRAS